MVTPIDAAAFRLRDRLDDELSPDASAPADAGDPPSGGGPMHAASMGRSPMLARLVSVAASAGFSVVGFAAHFDLGIALAGLTAVVGTYLALKDRWHKDEMRRQDEEAERRRRQDEADREARIKGEEEEAHSRLRIMKEESDAKIKILRDEERFRRTSLNAQIGDLKRDLEGLHKDKHDLAGKLNTATLEVVAVKDDMARLTGQIAVLTQENERLKADLSRKAEAAEVEDNTRRIASIEESGMNPIANPEG